MEYINQIFERLDIQNIQSFLLHGVDCSEIDSRTYEERIAKAQKSTMEMIKTICPDMAEYDTVTGEVYNYANTMRDVHMEIGLRCGAVLAAQLFSTGKGPHYEF